MAGYNGRDMVIKWDGTTIVGVRTKGTTMANSLIDVTNDDDNGWRTLLADPALKTIEATVSFITTNDTLLDEFFNASVTGETLLMLYPIGGTAFEGYTGTFLLQDLEITGEYDGAVEGTATFVSTGSISRNSVS